MIHSFTSYQMEVSDLFNLFHLHFIAIHFSSITNSTITYEISSNTNEFFQRAIFFNTEITMRMVRARLISTVDAAFVQRSTLKNVRPVTFAQALPFIYESESLDVMLIVGIALFPSAISFLMPLFLHSLVMEKEKKLREMMKMMGMSSTIYWLVNYIVSQCFIVLIIFYSLIMLFMYVFV